MKKFLLLFILFSITTKLFSQVPHTVISFKYDGAGNQYVRYFDLSKKSKEASTEQVTEDISEGTPQNTDLTRAVNLFPNPIENELNLDWSASVNTYVKSIQVYSLGSKMIENRTPSKSTQQYKINFNHYASGIYIIRILFDNGKQETFKVIKK